MLICLLGVTCVGKDTIAEEAQKKWPEDVGLIQVGKAMRLRHPPGYFDGKGAMEHTEDEAWSIFTEQLQAAENKKLVVCVGQPRILSQVERVIALERRKMFLWFTSSHETDRITQRFKNDSASMELSLRRRANDRIQYYDVLHQLLYRNQIVVPFVNDNAADLSHITDWMYQYVR